MAFLTSENYIFIKMFVNHVSDNVVAKYRLTINSLPKSFIQSLMFLLHLKPVLDPPTKLCIEKWYLSVLTMINKIGQINHPLQRYCHNLEQSNFYVWYYYHTHENITTRFQPN
jgi:hypothetical protein